ncbi:MAG: cytochrome b N-terminal domain-containing protein [Gemmatimonadota bacterium]|nr:MAG: cytochrome b N-terminal domain-containing protein [Gemmatimonadota bacterium]
MSETKDKPRLRWLAQIWADLKASTDPALLAVARFLGLVYGPIDRTLPIDQAARKALGRRLPSHAGWRHALGGITYLLFMVLVVTGVLLSFYYRPSVQEAYPSIQYIVSEVPLGWLVRDLHVWSANLIVVAIMAHMARVFFSGTYKPPRETNWVVGLLLLLVVLAFGGTGYLLPWDQWAYWTTTEVLDTVSRAPLLGIIASVLQGDVVVSGATLSRFFAVHVILLPWAAFALLLIHFTLVRKQGIAPPPGRLEDRSEGVPFFPNHLLRSFVVGVLVLAVTFSLAALYPRPVGDPANPFELPTELVSSWIVVDVSLALIRYLGVWGFSLFTLLGITMAVLPLFDRNPERRLRRRPVVLALGLLFFAGYLVAWLAGRQLESMPLDTELRSGEAAERFVPQELEPQTPEGGSSAEDTGEEEDQP